VRGTGGGKLSCDKAPYFICEPDSQTKIVITRYDPHHMGSQRVSIAMLPVADWCLNVPDWRKFPARLFGPSEVPVVYKIRFRGAPPYTRELVELHKPFAVPFDVSVYLKKIGVTNDTEQLTANEAGILSTMMSLTFEDDLTHNSLDQTGRMDPCYPYPVNCRFQGIPGEPPAPALKTRSLERVPLSKGTTKTRSTQKSSCPPQETCSKTAIAPSTRTKKSKKSSICQ
ncbi:unnamed protein product, partial [Mesorhabditis spiculigera]